jgi:excisionase family DNA binding protein
VNASDRDFGQNGHFATLGDQGSRWSLARHTVNRVTGQEREERLIGSGEVARQLGVSTSTVSSWVRRGWITAAVKTAGGRLRFRMSEVEAQLRARGMGTGSGK